MLEKKLSAPFFSPDGKTDGKVPLTPKELEILFLEELETRISRMIRERTATLDHNGKSPSNDWMMPTLERNLEIIEDLYHIIDTGGMPQEPRQKGGKVREERGVGLRALIGRRINSLLAARNNGIGDFWLIEMDLKIYNWILEAYSKFYQEPSSEELPSSQNDFSQRGIIGFSNPFDF